MQRVIYYKLTRTTCNMYDISFHNSYILSEKSSPSLTQQLKISINTISKLENVCAL